MSRENSDRSGGGFWSFLRKEKKPSLEEEKKDPLGNEPAAQDTSESPEDRSFEAMLAHWETEWGDLDEPSTKPSEPSEEAESKKPEASEEELSEEVETRRSEPSAWEIFEEAEILKPEVSEEEPSEEAEPQKPETPEEEPSEEAEAQHPEETTSVSGITVEELRGLEEQVASLESCIAERLNPRR